eukprot:6188652-Pleurochrysis_carterae.AAC.1
MRTCEYAERPIASTAIARVWTSSAHAREGERAREGARTRARTRSRGLCHRNVYVFIAVCLERPRTTRSLLELQPVAYLQQVVCSRSSRPLYSSLSHFPFSLPTIFSLAVQ